MAEADAIPSYPVAENVEMMLRPTITDDNLKRIQERLKEDDLWKLKLLLSSIVPIDDLRESETASTVLKRVQKNAASKEDFEYVVAEVLYTIKRFDLLKLTGLCKHSVGNYFNVHARLEANRKAQYAYAESCTDRSPEEILDDFLIVSPLTNQKSLLHECSTDKSSNQDHYSFIHSPCGYCLIINNEHFQKEPFTTRLGSSYDRDNLKDVFETFDFEVDVCDDLTQSEMLKKFDEVKKKDFINYDCFICCILSHGELGAIYGTDGEAVLIDAVRNKFVRSECPSLYGKPKIFFIQACQGTTGMPGKYRVEADGIVYKGQPNYCDFATYMATVKGYASYRKKDQGSWFIIHLTATLAKSGHELSLNDIMTEVNNKVSNEAGINRNDNTPVTQMPVFESSLTKILKFKRKRQPEEA